jgi:hypothetical protein
MEQMMEHLLAEIKVGQEKMDTAMRANREEMKAHQEEMRAGQEEMRARMEACHQRAGAYQIGMWAEIKTNQEEMKAS